MCLKSRQRGNALEQSQQGRGSRRWSPERWELDGGHRNDLDFYLERDGLLFNFYLERDGATVKALDRGGTQSNLYSGKFTLPAMRTDH